MSAQPATPQPWAILRPHRIRWAECDLYGHVNHAAYLTLFEDLRVDHWQALTGAPSASRTRWNWPAASRPSAAPPSCTPMRC